MSRAESQIAALAQVGRSVLEGIGLQPDCCVAATRAGLDVLKAWGIKARPLLCEAGACNMPFRQGKRDASAYVVQVDSGIETKPEDVEMREHPASGLLGHLVIAIELQRFKARRHLLLDLSAYQFDRPSRGIIVPDAIVFDSKGALTDAWTLSFDLPEMGMLLYRAHHKPAVARYEDARDWKLPSADEQSIHREVVSLLKMRAENFVASVRPS